MVLAAVALGAVALVGAEVSQRDDWLVGGSGATAQLRVERSAGGQVTALSLENGLVQRLFTVRGGALCTTEYKNLVSEQTFFRAISPEANITLNGHGFDVGGCDGQPNKTMEFWTPDDWKANLTASPTAFQFHNYSQSAPAALFPWKPGTRHTPTTLSWPPTGVHLQLVFVPPAGAPAELAQVRVVVHYELYDNLPTFRKWVSVHNGAAGVSRGLGAGVEIDSLIMELLRAPNFAPERMSVITQQANNPTPFDEEVKPELSQSFPGRTKQFWHFDPDYDQCCDQEIHVTYTYYTFLLVGYGFDTTFHDTGGSNTTGPGVLLASGEEFSSLSCRFVLHDSNEMERQGLGVRKTMMTLAPSLMENPMIWMITDITGCNSPLLFSRRFFCVLSLTTMNVHRPEPICAAAAGGDAGRGDRPRDPHRWLRRCRALRAVRRPDAQRFVGGVSAATVGFGCDYCHTRSDATVAAANRWFKSEVEFAASKGIGISACTHSTCLPPFHV